MMLDRGRERERERVDSASDETRITRRLWLVLGGLVFMIIGLGVGILLTNLGRDENKAEKIDCDQTEKNTDEIIYCIREKNGDNEEALVAAYTRAIGYAKNINDGARVVDLFRERAKVVEGYEGCQKALETYEQNLDGLDAETLRVLYLVAADASEACGETDLATKYREKSMQTEAGNGGMSF